MKKISFYTFCMGPAGRKYVEKAEGWKCREYAVHGEKGYWSITHIDSGMRIEGGYITRKYAEEAVLQGQFDKAVAKYLTSDKGKKLLTEFEDLVHEAFKAEEATNGET